MDSITKCSNLAIFALAILDIYHFNVNLDVFSAKNFSYFKKTALMQIYLFKFKEIQFNFIHKSLRI